MKDRIDVVCEFRCQLGEGPLWSLRDNAVYWVDILSAELHRLRLDDDSVDSWSMPEKTGWVVERRDQPGFIAGLQNGFHALTLDPFQCRLIADPEPDRPGNRMNDAKVDRFGRIWAGTMDCDARDSSGSLYRLDTDLTVSTHDREYLVTNGPAIDPARNRFYHSDTGRGIVYLFDMSPAGEILNKRTFIRFHKEWGLPDGMTVDAQGGLWIAHWGGGRVTRFTPDGKPDRDILLPASQITSCTFAGENLDRLFVTSAAVDRDEEPQAGMLFEVDPGTKGLPTNQFAA